MPWGFQQQQQHQPQPLQQQQSHHPQQQQQAQQAQPQKYRQQQQVCTQPQQPSSYVVPQQQQHRQGQSQQQQQTQPNRYEYACMPVASTSTLVAGDLSLRQPKTQPQAQQQLPEDVYRKLKQVDQQSSTLTVAHGRAGGSGFSARILDKRDYKHNNEETVVQLVEIIKKPGQSLGLYLREGNGIDRFTGVFASRLGEHSELERFGDIVQPGDEILNVNNVEVTPTMSIDDVVLMLSIPRRLLLRISYMKNRRKTYGMSEPQPAEQRPVVIFQKSLSEEHRTHQGRHRPHRHSHSHQNPGGASSAAANAALALEPSAATNAVGSHYSTTSKDGGGGILLKPASTAATWLGKRARQQQQQQQQYLQRQQQEELQYRQQHFQQQQSNPMSTAYGAAAFSLPSDAVFLPTQQYYSQNIAQQQQPRVLDVSGRPIGRMVNYALNPANPIAQQQLQHTQQQRLPNNNLLRYPLSEQLGTRRRHAAYASATLGRPGTFMDTTTTATTSTGERATSAGVTRRPLTTVGVPCSYSVDYGKYPEDFEFVAGSSANYDIHSGVGVPAIYSNRPSSINPRFSQQQPFTTSQQDQQMARRQQQQQQTGNLQAPWSSGLAGAAVAWPNMNLVEFAVDSNATSNLPYKSNSLPRRRIQSALSVGTMPARSVKWRNDLVNTIHPSARPTDAYTVVGADADEYDMRRDAFSDVAVATLHLPTANRCNLMNGVLPQQAASSGQPTAGSSGRTIADIFSAQEYKNWASTGDETMSEIGATDYGQHRSRWYGNTTSGGASLRSSSLPSKTILRNNIYSAAKTPHAGATMSMSAVGFPATAAYRISQDQQLAPSQSDQFNVSNNNNNSRSKGCYLPTATGGVSVGQPIMDNLGTLSGSTAERASDILDRLHVSPLMNRRVPLRTLGSGFDVDRLSVNALSGILTVSIVEGKHLKVPDKMHSRQMYVVLEVDEVHRARTGISVPEQQFRWNESFEIDVQNATDAQFFVYAWHAQLKHLFCHKGSMRLLDAFFVDQLSGQRVFTLNLEPSGQLLIRVAFADMTQAYARNNCNTAAVFGASLEQMLQREKTETPVALTRLIHEIEERGVSTPGLYYLCGSMERKNYLRDSLEHNSRGADLSDAPVPDVNLLTCLVKDFLRLMPQPLIPLSIYAMLVDAQNVLSSTATTTAGGSSGASADNGGVAAEKDSSNQQFVLRIIDCLPTANKNTLILVMDHLRNLLGAEPHNGLTASRLSAVFGSLIFCTTESASSSSQQQQQRQANAETTTTTASAGAESNYKAATKLNSLNGAQAANALKLLLELWPCRVNSSESNSSSNATPP